MGRYGSNSRHSYFPEYVSVADRKKQAQKKIAAMKKKGHDLQPVVIEGQTIAKTYWGKAWCKHLETYKDYENRLPRGRSYVRHGAVIDLKLEPCAIHAQVDGLSVYTIKITIDAVNPSRWQSILDSCAGKIDSLIELLQGKFSKNVMEVMTNVDTGLFPSVKEIKFSCTCPDHAYMCKHVAAVLYGIGARIDHKPEDLFLLRQADYAELIANVGSMTMNTSLDQDTGIADGDLNAMFGIEMDEPEVTSKPKAKPEAKVATNPTVVAKAKAGIKAKSKLKPQKLKKLLRSGV